MTNQELFDKVVTNLLKQGRQSRGYRGTCQLRGEGGAKCAIGWLIPDEKYSWGMEDWVIVCNLRRFSILGIWTEDQESLVKELQDVHDGYRDYNHRIGFRGFVRVEAFKIALKYGLQMPKENS